MKKLLQKLLGYFVLIRLYAATLFVRVIVFIVVVRWIILHRKRPRSILKPNPSAGKSN
jgi:hypothetical protein